MTCPKRTVIAGLIVLVGMMLAFLSIAVPDDGSNRDSLPQTVTPRPVTVVDEQQPVMETQSQQSSIPVPLSVRPLGVLSTKGEVRGERYLTFNDLYSWYGVSNMLICYSAAISYALQDNRSVVMPVNGSIAFFDLFDTEATIENIADAIGNNTFTIRHPKDVPQSLKPATSMNKRGLHLPERQYYRNSSPKVGVQRLAYIMHRSKKYRFVRHHNFFMRYPWSSSVGGHSECYFMARIVLHKAIREHAEELIGVMREPFVAIHLRLETDSKLIRAEKAADPTAEHFEVFVKQKILPLATMRNATTAYLCTGNVPTQFAAILGRIREETGLRIVHYATFARSLTTKLPSAFGDQRQSHATEKGVKRTQDHYRSAVEMAVLSRAAAAVMPVYSTFKFPVYARRCQSSPNISPIEVYDIDRSGVFGSLTSTRCDAHRAWCGDATWGK